ncbi:MAG: penicillin acylase family protein [Halioglobus sp.]
MRRVLRVASALIALGLLLAVVLWWLLRASLPPVEGEFGMPGLSAVARVSYDAWQRPYVQAATLDDALQVQGLHASHRLWQMELLRRAGSGRMAALLLARGLTRPMLNSGAPGCRSLRSACRRMRGLPCLRTSTAMWPASTRDSALPGFAAGVSAGARAAAALAA